MAPHRLEKWQPLPPTEHNRFCVFCQDLEADPLVLFHASPKRHFDAIATSGFRSAAALGHGELTSVSYAKNSSSCLAHIGNPVPEDYVVLAVRFDTLALKGIVENTSDIHVYDAALQPRILGYCELPKGFRVS
ncbi:MAG: hypothetical protein U0575_04255 [Phycisphaerales bacterium]